MTALQKLGKRNGFGEISRQLSPEMCIKKAAITV